MQLVARFGDLSLYLVWRSAHRTFSSKLPIVRSKRRLPLEETLKEEKMADAKLTEIGETLMNTRAASHRAG
jgi:hypothetical protein